MIILVAAIAGASFGAVLAKRREGNVLDMLQYGAACAIAFTIVAVFLAIFIERMA